MIVRRDKSELRMALAVVVVGLLVGLCYNIYLWQMDERGLSIFADKLPYWDFSNLWAGGVLAVKGEVHILFDVDAYRAALRAMFNPLLPNQEWSYPPSILLIGVPLSLLPLPVAYAGWTLGTLVLLHVALRPLKFPPIAHIAVLLSPAAMMNALLGQNGALTAALLIGGLLLAPKRPILAGIAFGLLTIKPHLGLLIPFCLLASRNYRAILSAALTGLALFAASASAFGLDSWVLFLTKTGPLMAAIMEAPYPEPYHANAITGFIFARWVGLGVTGAYASQACLFVLAAATTVWLWLPKNPMPHAKRVCLTATLGILATPYGYSYDTIPMCVAAAYLFLTERRSSLPVFALIWLYPLFLHMMNRHGIGVSILVPLTLVLIALWPRPSFQSDEGLPTTESEATAS